MKRGPAPQRPPGGLAAMTLALASLLVPAGGCSFLFVSGPPAGYQRQPYFTCTSGVGWPIVDGAFAALMAGTFIDAASSSDFEYATQGYTRTQDLTYSAVFGGLALASAIFGFVRTSECRTALEELNARPQPHPAAPPPGFSYPPAAYPPPPGYGPPPGYAPPPGYPPPAGYPPGQYDPWAPPPAPPAAPPAPPPAPPAPAPPTPQAPPPSARVVPRLRLELAPLIGRLGTRSAGALLATTRLRLARRY